MLKKNFLIPAAGLLFIFIVNGCEKKPEEAAEVLETENVTVALTPSIQEMKGEMFTLKLSDLKIRKTVQKATKEITAASLEGSIKITNNSTNILDIKEMTIQYLDASGNPIPFKDGEKKATISAVYWSDIQPGKDSSEASLDVKVPMDAVKKKSINKIRSHVVYIPTPLKSESMDVPITIEKQR
ncbi:MAG: hypothetical protein L6406_11340 [Desulfobacterales bacterium]|nr:hypothetical protein [Desulfobacterales bacterium]